MEITLILEKAHADFLSLHEKKDWNTVLNKCISIGIMAISSSSVESILSNELKSMMHTISDKMEKKICEMGEKTEKHVKSNITTIRKFAEKSIENVTVECDNLGEKIDEFTELIKKKEIEQSLVNKTTLKGPIFEEDCVYFLSSFAKTNSLSIEHIGGDNSQGDILIEGNKAGIFGFKCIVECKDFQSAWGKQKIDTTMKTAMEKRKTKYGIFVTKTTAGLAKEMGDFSISTTENNWVACTKDFLEIAVLHCISKFFLDKEKQYIEENSKYKQLNLDNVSKLKKLTKQLETKVNEFSQLKKEIETIRNTALSMESLTTKIKEDLLRLIKDCYSTLSLS